MQEKVVKYPINFEGRGSRELEYQAPKGWSIEEVDTESCVEKKRGGYLGLLRQVCAGGEATLKRDLGKGSNAKWMVKGKAGVQAPGGTMPLTGVNAGASHSRGQNDREHANHESRTNVDIVILEVGGSTNSSMVKSGSKVSGHALITLYKETKPVKRSRPPTQRPSSSRIEQVHTIDTPTATTSRPSFSNDARIRKLIQSLQSVSTEEKVESPRPGPTQQPSPSKIEQVHTVVTPTPTTSRPSLFNVVAVDPPGTPSSRPPTLQETKPVKISRPSTHQPPSSRIEQVQTIVTPPPPASRPSLSNVVAIDPGIPPNIREMVQSLESASTEEKVSNALGELRVAARDDTNCVHIAKVGGIKLVLSAMQQHPNSEKVQELACWALINLSVNAENKVTIAKAGGVGWILSAMQRHPNAEKVQENACGALWGLSVNAENQVTIAKAGGIEWILSAMQQHPNAEKVQEQACGALRNLAANDENKVTIANAGGVELIVIATLRHPAAEQVQCCACGALRKLSANTDNQVTIAKAGGVEWILRAMQRYPKADKVQENACWALANLSVIADNEVTVAKAGGIKWILSAMQRHPNAEQVQQQACRALRNLSANDENQVTIAEAGGIKSILSAMQRHPNAEKVQENACAALRNLSRGNADNKITIAEAGGVNWF